MSYTENYEIPIVPSAIAQAVATFQPKLHIPTPSVTTRKWKLADIKDPANTFILVLKENPKQPGSDAHLLWPVQGAVGAANVTVAEFLRIGAELKGKMGALGAARVRSDLIWNLNKGWIVPVDANGNRLD